MNPAAAHIASEEERHKVLSTITAAFIHDPIFRWVWPEPHSYLSNMPAFAEAFGGGAIVSGSAQCTTGYCGAALWLEPGSYPDEDRIADIIQHTVSPEKLEDVFSVLKLMGEHHPDEPVWHLAMIGVDPTKYGCGHGATMMHAFLERIDSAGLPAYLESTNPANITLYQRHGFETTGTIQAGESPKIYPMYREARK